MIVWSAGVIVVGGGLLIALWRLRQTLAGARPISSGPWHDMASRIGARYGVSGGVVLLRTGEPHLLATCGLAPASILLPSHACDWPEDRIHAVLCHELAHVRRRDWAVQIAAEALLALVWFNPLMWIACRRLRQEAERACDDIVLSGGMPAHDYAAHVLALARACRRTSWSWMPAVQMAHASMLERRITAMLNPNLDRRGLSRRAAIAASALLLLVAAGTATLRAWQGPPAALTGTVYDPTGGVMPGVALTLRDPNGGAANAATNSAGRFSFPGIGPGHYTLEAKLMGFRSLQQELDLAAARDFDRAVTLQVGELRETITVSERRLPAAPQPAANAPIRVGGNIRVPMKTLDVKPTYPASMRQAGREADVRLDAIIGRDGSVASVRVLTGQIHPDFAIAAADAVREWKFTPTLLNGAPIEVVMTVTVSFKLSD